MAYVTDSRFIGFMGPMPAPHPDPLEDGGFIDWLQAMVAGITDLPGNLVRPRWQPEPPPTPDITVDWAAIGITSSTEDYQPAIIHVSTGDGYDMFQRMEQSELLCSFYGPNCQRKANLLRDGLFIPQHVSLFREAAVAVIETDGLTHVPEMFRERWRDRVDLRIRLRREIRRDYPVLNLLRALGVITAEPPYESDRLIDTGFDTGVPDFPKVVGSAGGALAAGPGAILGAGIP